LSNCNAVKSQILALLGNQQMRLTPSALERELCRDKSQFSKKVIRSIIKEMVAEGSLQYTNHFSTTHLELNYNRPTQVSERIILSPHICSSQNYNPEALLIVMDQGGAFGLGDHPTTRLSLRGVDIVMKDALKRGSLDGFQALDIGTGSGVLAMAAVGLGAAGAMGIDIDPAALHEAGRNIELNGMESKIMLTSDSLESLGDYRFSLITANLRPPTIQRMLPLIDRLSTSEAYWVISGCREDALENVIAMLPLKKIKIIWKETSCGWAALAVKAKCRAIEALN
jgi:ribosomal protein L11 methyltransferase